MDAEWVEQLDADVVREGCAPAPVLPGKALGELRLEKPDPNELLKERFLCRRGGLLVVAPTGVGKSALAMQAAICWVAGCPCFGLVPRRELTIWLIQAENDEGDLVEQRDGISAGLTATGVLTDEQLAEAMTRLRVVTEVAANGDRFGEWLWAKLGEAQTCDALPDMVIIDPAFSFLGGDALSQRDVSRFLRNVLNPVLFHFNVGCLLVHHTNKPVSLKEKNAAHALGDLAYLGAGSAEWANWARAILAIEKTGDPGIFRLHAAKRGKRLRWREPDGRPTLCRYVAHDRTEGRIFWREPDGREVADIPARSQHPSAKTVKTDDLLRLASPPVPKTVLLVNVQNHLGIGRDKARDHVRACIEAKQLLEVQVVAQPHYKLVGLPGEVEPEAERRIREYKMEKAGL